jgi:hypothetical protein
VKAIARGTFDVKLKPLPAREDRESAPYGRMSIDKVFSGDLQAKSFGEMLSVRTDNGSAGYVAIEQVTGELAGRSGTFVLQHSGTMTREASQLTVSVVPDSATGELKGLSGVLAIVISDGVHAYEFAYAFT